MPKGSQMVECAQVYLAGSISTPLRFYVAVT